MSQQVHHGYSNATVVAAVDAAANSSTASAAAAVAAAAAAGAAHGVPRGVVECVSKGFDLRSLGLKGVSMRGVLGCGGCARN